MKTKHSTIFIVIVMLVVLFVMAIFLWWVLEKKQTTTLIESPAGTALLPSEQAAPYTDMSGNQLTLQQHIGKVLIVHSWASWCPQCATDLQTLDTTASSYSEDDVVVLAINRSEPAVTANRYLHKTVGDVNRITLVLDQDDAFYNSLEGYAMPETIVFDTNGEEVVRFRTALEVESLRAQIDKLLSE